MKKKRILNSYFDGITDHSHGESFGAILKYFFPEFITNLIIYAMPFFIDSLFVAYLRSTSAYTTLTLTNTMLHVLVKVGEGFSIGGLVLIGQYNGLKKFEEAGSVLVELFWATILASFVIAGSIYGGAYWIYKWYGVPEEMIALGIPFLRLRAIGLFLTFIYFALVGFLRGIKDTKTPMFIFIFGGTILILFDYLLIFGKAGFPEMKLQGSAVATVLQYGSMLAVAILFILFNKETRKYSIHLFSHLTSWGHLKSILILSWPMMLDKMTFAGSYAWLGAMLAPMGKYVLASYGVIKDMERFAIMPAIAFAQIITLLVSNDYGRKDWLSIKSNIKKIIFLSSIMVFTILLIFSLWPRLIIQAFDQKGKFTEFSAIVFPILSVLVFFDLLQLILAGALRGAQQVKTVLWVRFVTCIVLFFPLSYFISSLTIENPIIKFLLMYGSFYAISGFMSIVYIAKFRGESWKVPSV